MAIKIEMLRCFCAVAKAGNLSDAADQLGRTQSAVSMTLKQLESHLDSRLFENERKNRLTPLGEQVFETGLQQLKQFDQSVQTIELAARAPQGVLKISAVPSVAALAYPKLVRHMLAFKPGLKIELRDSDTQQVIEALLQGWADIGIASSRQVLKGITATLLFSDQYGLALSENHPLARRKEPVGINQVFEAPFLRNSLCDQIETHAFQSALSESDVTAQNIHSLLAMIREWNWVTVLPRSLIELAPNGLLFRPIVDLPDRRHVYMYRRNRTASDDVITEAHNFFIAKDWEKILDQSS